MPIKKWLLQYLIAWPSLVLILGGVQYLKGRDLGYSTQFGLLWATLSLTVFAITRAYNFRKNVYCAVCNDLPQPGDSNSGS